MTLPSQKEIADCLIHQTGSIVLSEETRLKAAAAVLALFQPKPDEVEALARKLYVYGSNSQQAWESWPEGVREWWRSVARKAIRLRNDFAADELEKCVLTIWVPSCSEGQDRWKARIAELRGAQP